MQVSLVVGEHRAGIEREQRVGVAAQLDVDFGELGPRYELGGCAVDGLLGKFVSPFGLALTYMRTRISSEPLGTAS